MRNNIFILQAHNYIKTYQNIHIIVYIYIYICYTYVSLRKSPPSLLASIQSQTVTFLPETPRNESEILISVNSEQDVPISIVSH